MRSRHSGAHWPARAHNSIERTPGLDIEQLDGDEVGGTSLDHFLAEGLITDVVRIIKTGKEASVHLC